MERDQIIVLIAKGLLPVNEKIFGKEIAIGNSQEMPLSRYTVMAVRTTGDDVLVKVLIANGSAHGTSATIANGVIALNTLDNLAAVFKVVYDAELQAGFGGGDDTLAIEDILTPLRNDIATLIETPLPTNLRKLHVGDNGSYEVLRNFLEGAIQLMENQSLDSVTSALKIADFSETQEAIAGLEADPKAALTIYLKGMKEFIDNSDKTIFPDMAADDNSATLTEIDALLTAFGYVAGS